MAKRKFELPGIHDLSKEQEDALALPKEGQHLIVGGPGTGKTVLSLIRARRHARDQDDYRFLVFNHLLHRFSSKLFGDSFAGETWDRWFRATFQETTGRTIPTLPPQSNGFRPIDWDSVQKIIEELPSASTHAERPFLVIDEGQDMPPQFYSSLVNLGFNRFFVAADQNQQITAANSSRRDIENVLAVDTDDVVELDRNYRNTYPVAKLAQAFYTGDPASPPPELPTRSAAHVPLLYLYEKDSIDRIAKGILRLSDRDPRQLIGVIAPNNQVRQRYVDALRAVSMEVPLDNPRPSIETFHVQHRPAVAFDEGGILVINAQTCKGLEFDTVILADIDAQNYRTQDPDVAKRRLYVMVARATERIYMFMKKGSQSLIEELLPEDGELLRREEL